MRGKTFLFLPTTVNELSGGVNNELTVANGITACGSGLPCFGFLFFDPLGLAQHAQNKRNAEGEAEGTSCFSRQRNTIISVCVCVFFTTRTKTQ